MHGFRSWRHGLLLLALAIVLLTSASQAGFAQNPKRAPVDFTENLILAPIAGTDEYLAYSKRTGEFRKQAVAKGVAVAPVVRDSVAVLSAEGRKVTELIGVDRDGNWHVLTLPKPASGKCVPIVSDQLALFHIDGRAYAFSGITGTWDSVPAAASPAVGDEMARIVEADRETAFSASTGKWAAARATGARR